jgi:hypothetical protein
MLFLTAIPIVVNFLEMRIEYTIFQSYWFQKSFLLSIEYHRRDSTIPAMVLQMPPNDVQKLSQILMGTIITDHDVV